ncbi:nuclear transport factor 2 family protein [Kitasatospora sp. NPDC056651]|uniref:nuclear transport factor 2 family protein n=1 Tax=Kitasatospora sp. NPDC056651 TaxID=3345892 RepID=UPI0036C04704
METVVDLGEKVDATLRVMEAGDLAGLRALCAADATVWQNDGAGTRTIEKRIEHIAEFFAGIESVRFEVVRRFHKPDEVLQQHVLHLVGTDGVRSRVHATAHFRFEDGLIASVEEYLYEVPEAPQA